MLPLYATICYIIFKSTEQKFGLFCTFLLSFDSNLQREEILPSEKAFAYKMKLDAMKRQGKRTDLTSVPPTQKLQGKTSRELLAEQVGESQDQIRRYIRLTELLPSLLDMVDEGEIAMRLAVELSYQPKKKIGASG